MNGRIIFFNPMGYLFGNSCCIHQEKKSSQNLLRCKHCKLKIVICSHSITGFQKFLPWCINRFSSTLILLHHFPWMVYTLPIWHTTPWPDNLNSNIATVMTYLHLLLQALWLTTAHCGWKSAGTMVLSHYGRQKVSSATAHV